MHSRFVNSSWARIVKQKPFYIKDAEYIPPLVMTGGNPYIRALMRTISESEANGDPILFG